MISFSEMPSSTASFVTARAFSSSGELPGPQILEKRQIEELVAVSFLCNLGGNGFQSDARSQTLALKTANDAQSATGVPLQKERRGETNPLDRPAQGFVFDPTRSRCKGAVFRVNLSDRNHLNGLSGIFLVHGFVTILMGRHHS